MKPDDQETRELLRQLSQQARMAIWISSACLGLLLFVLFFPQYAEQISGASVKFQQWLEPYFGGIVGIAFALIVVFISAAYVVSRIFPQASVEPDSRTERLGGTEIPRK